MYIGDLGKLNLLAWWFGCRLKSTEGNDPTAKKLLLTLKVVKSNTKIIIGLYFYQGTICTKRFADLDKLNLVKLGRGGLDLGMSQISNTTPAEACFKSDLKIIFSLC